MARHAAIFPGQGAQLVGMGRDVADRFPVAAEVFARGDAVLGFALSKLCFEGPAERLNTTDIQQPAIFVTSVAIYRAALECGKFTSQTFVAMGGLSLGEYTALHLGGAVSFDDALRLVDRRGKLMQAASERRHSGMVSLVGFDEQRALALCERVAAKGRIGPANYNCPGQIVVSGEQAGCDAAVGLAEEFGGKAVPLDVAGAFHSELMRPAAEGLRPVLDACAFRAPAVRVISNVDAEYHADATRIRDSLYAQIFNPVRWQACVERLIEDGCETFWEIGPNRVLKGLMRRINRSVKALNVSSVSDLE